MLFTFILVVQAIIAAVLVTVILMQRSEGGGLGMGGSPSGFMSARGAADFLTRATTVLATAFIVLSIALAFIAATRHRASNIDTSLVGQTSPLQTAPAAPPPSGGTSPLTGTATPPTGGAQAGGAQAGGNGAVPIAQ